MLLSLLFNLSGFPVDVCQYVFSFLLAQFSGGLAFVLAGQRCGRFRLLDGSFQIILLTHIVKNGVFVLQILSLIKFLKGARDGLLHGVLKILLHIFKEGLLMCLSNGRHHRILSAVVPDIPGRGQPEPPALPFEQSGEVGDRLEVVGIRIGALSVGEGERPFDQIDIGDVFADEFEAAEGESAEAQRDEEGEESEEHPDAELRLTQHIGFESGLGYLWAGVLPVLADRDDEELEEEQLSCMRPTAGYMLSSRWILWLRWPTAVFVIAQ